MSKSFEMKDASQDVIKQMDSTVNVVLGAVGAEATTYAQKDCPVDTGRLRNSIAWATSRDSGGFRMPGEGEPSEPQATPEDGTVYIGSNVDYAEYVEYGDAQHKVGKKHFLRDSIANHVDYYKAIIEAALKG